MRHDNLGHGLCTNGIVVPGIFCSGGILVSLHFSLRDSRHTSSVSRGQRPGMVAYELCSQLAFGGCENR